MNAARQALEAAATNGAARPVVSIIIPTWRRRKSLRRLLFTIARAESRFPREVIVVDSESGDGTDVLVERFSRRVFPVRLVQTYNALAAKRNAGAAHASGDYLVFLDDDLRIADKDALDAVVSEAAGQEAPVCFRVSYPPDWVQRSNYYRFKQYAHDVTNQGPREIPPFRFVAMAFCIRKDLYERCQGFSEQFRTYGGEDHAFEFALRRIGVVPVLSERARVLHYEPSGDLGAYLHKKIVVMVRDAFPLFFASYPEGRPRSAKVLESKPVAALIRLIPKAVWAALVNAAGWAMERIPAWMPVRVLRLVGSVGALFAYCLALKSRR